MIAEHDGRRQPIRQAIQRANRVKTTGLLHCGASRLIYPLATASGSVPISPAPPGSIIVGGSILGLTPQVGAPGRASRLGWKTLCWRPLRGLTIGVMRLT